MKTHALKITTLDNGRFDWQGSLGDAKRGATFGVKSSDVHSSRVALTRYKGSNPKFRYYTSTDRSGYMTVTILEAG